MNYAKIYEQLISNAKINPFSGYTEKHHIVPKCMGGGDTFDNIVSLSARQHFIAHWLLYKIHGTKELAFAWRVMCINPKNNQRSKVNSHSFKLAKEAWAIEMSRLNTGVKFSDKRIENLRQAHLGQKAWNKGIATGETASRKARIEHYMANPQRCVTCGQPIPYRFKSRARKYCCKKCQFADPNRIVGKVNRKPNSGSFKKGHTLKGETVKKISDKLTGMKRPRGVCPHCGTEGALSLLKRWHFDNCKKG